MGYSSFAYYSIFTRAFEISFGALVFYINIYVIQKKRVANSFLLANIFSIVGLTFVILAIIFINETNTFPGYYALLPVLGAGSILLSGSINNNTWICRLLSTKPLVIIGLISYSLYLWHWPILAFWRYEFPLQEISIVNGLIFIVIILILSFLSYHLIEKPIRHSKISLLKIFIFLQIMPVIILCLTREYAMNTNGLSYRLYSLSQPKNKIRNDVAIDNSILNSSGYIIGGASSKNSPKILLVGDSHAAQYKPFWNYLGIKWGFNIVFMDYKGCHALINRKDDQSIENNVNSDGCRKLINDFTKDYINYEVIVMAGRWGADLRDDSSIVSGQKFSLINGNTYESDYDMTINELTSKGKKVIIMGDSPNERNSSIDAYYRHRFLARYSFLQLESKDQVLKFDFYDNHYANSIMKQFTVRYQNVYYFDFNQDVLSHIITFPFINDELLYMDSNHLSQEGSLDLAESFVTFDSSRKLWDKLHEFGIIQQEGTLH